MSDAVASSTRVKACSECRRHKLKCDARNDYAKPCSRCKRLKLECVVLRCFESSKPTSRSELRAEISRLHARLKTLQAANPNASAPVTTSLSPPYQDGGSSLQPIDLDAGQIGDCFDLFMQHYAPQVCVVNRAMAAKDYYNLSPLLYWTIVTIGSRKYAGNPALVGILAPRLMEMVRSAIFSPDLSAIQAFLLLCIWPIPIDTFGKEISTTLSTLMFQFSLNKGLHIRGVGQDFSRVTLNPEPALEVLRAKLWISCLITAQRLNCAYGLPPPIIVDTFDTQNEDLPAGLLYERRISQLLATATVELGRVALRSDVGSTGELRSMVSLYSLQMSQFPAPEGDTMGHYHFLCALLQIQSFSIFVGQEHADPIALIKLYTTACTVIETVLRLDVSMHLARCASDYTGRMIYLAAFVVLRVHRSYLKKDVDVLRGQVAYRSAVDFFRKMSILSHDVMARSTVILTQLWNSTKVFKQPDGTFDSFSMLCRSRLTMSSVFDMWWRWREEFAGQPHPYAHGSGDGVSNPSPTAPPPPIPRLSTLPSATAISTAAGVSVHPNAAELGAAGPTLAAAPPPPPPLNDPSPPFEIHPHDNDNWDALLDLPVQSWDLFNLDHEDGLLNFDDPFAVPESLVP